MRQSQLWWGALLGGLTSLALTTIYYVGDQLAGLPFPPFDIFDWLGRALPSRVQWRLNWEGSPGEHSFTVRATDGEGTLQTAERTGTRPDGATGYHSVTATVAG